MKPKYISIVFAALFGTVGGGLSSCTDYLDKSPEAGLTEGDIFSSFDKFQGYIENAYFCMTDPMSGSGCTNFNIGDDLLQTAAWCYGNVLSDYRAWEKNGNMFYTNDLPQYDANPWKNGGDDGNSPLGFWDGGWFGIRKVNLALENFDKLIVAYRDCPIEEQRNLIKGQALFLRAYFHFQIIRVWGGMPYVTRSFSATDPLDSKRLTYQQTSDSIEADLLQAAELLPVDWDDTETGQITRGMNQGRLTKGAAYALLGKVMLYAGSPLMNGVSGGDYGYNKTYCEKAAKYFAEVLKLSEITGGSTYGLLPWNKYRENFLMEYSKIPATGKETLLVPPLIQRMRNSDIGDRFPSTGAWGNGCGPTENYVQNFGMANGKPFNPAVYNTPSINPWADRDPRFYINIVTDGSVIMKRSNDEVIAQLYVGGRDRGGANRSDTGYGWTKFREAKDYGWSESVNRRLPMIRLADVYLMYAEAVNEAYGANVAPAFCSIKAWEAVKAVRDRVLNADGTSLPFPAELYASTDILRETIRRERAVELAFEGHRWYDLRRWYVAHLPEYKRLDVLDFDENHTYYKVASYSIPKVFDKKHYWMPLKYRQSLISKDFPQNPGWE